MVTKSLGDLFALEQTSTRVAGRRDLKVLNRPWNQYCALSRVARKTINSHKMNILASRSGIFRSPFWAHETGSAKVRHSTGFPLCALSASAC